MMPDAIAPTIIRIRLRDSYVSSSGVCSMRTPVFSLPWSSSIADFFFFAGEGAGASTDFFGLVGFAWISRADSTCFFLSFLAGSASGSVPSARA